MAAWRGAAFLSVLLLLLVFVLIGRARVIRRD